MTAHFLVAFILLAGGLLLPPASVAQIGGIPGCLSVPCPVSDKTKQRSWIKRIRDSKMYHNVKKALDEVRKRRAAQNSDQEVKAQLEAAALRAQAEMDSDTEALKMEREERRESFSGAEYESFVDASAAMAELDTAAQASRAVRGQEAALLRMKALGGANDDVAECQRARLQIQEEAVGWIDDADSGRTDVLSLLLTPSGAKSKLSPEDAVLVEKGIALALGPMHTGGACGRLDVRARLDALARELQLNLAADSMRSALRARTAYTADGSVLSVLSDMLFEPHADPGSHYVEMRRQALLQAVRLRIMLWRFEASLRREALLAVRLAKMVS